MDETQPTLESQVEKAHKELSEEARKKYQRELDRVQKYNEAPCSVCGKSQFVMKYRDVNGKIEGRTSGSFSLFGGSISGYVNGEISTAPVLSCRECENERKILVAGYVSDRDIFKQQIPWISESNTRRSQVSDWLKGYGLEVAFALDDKLFARQLTDYNYRPYSDSLLATYGLVRKYKKPPVKIKFGFPQIVMTVAAIAFILIIIATL